MAGLVSVTLNNFSAAFLFHAQPGGGGLCRKTHVFNGRIIATWKRRKGASMRNLHHVGIRHNTPVFLAIITSLGIDIEPKRDVHELRRFIMGENLIPIDEPEKREVVRSIKFPVGITSGDTIDDFFDREKEKLTQQFLLKGIDLKSIKEINCCQGGLDGYNYEVKFTDDESDAELAERKMRADKFNEILAKKDEIYALVDAADARGEIKGGDSGLFV